MVKNTLSSWSRLPVNEWLSRHSSLAAWGCAFSFFAANVLLSYFPLSSLQALWTIFLGLLLPLCLLALTPRPSPAPKNPWRAEAFPFIPSWLVGALWVLAVLLRLY